MKTFSKSAAQGELYIERVDAIPRGATKQDPEDGRYVVGHSETGHHHVVDASGVDHYAMDPYTDFLDVKVPFAQLRHLRDWDTHETLRIDRGVYIIRKQIQPTIDGWEKVID